MHRVTYHPAIGSATAGGFRYYVPRAQISSADQTSHSQLKYRQPGQNSINEIQNRNLQSQLEINENNHKLQQINNERSIKNLPLLTELPSDTDPPQLLLTGDTATANSTVEIDVNELAGFNDADDNTIQAQISSGDDDSDAETAELQAELERIKHEREQAKLKSEQNNMDTKHNNISSIEYELLSSNPLLASTHGIRPQHNHKQLSRNWSDDAVFSDNARDHDSINKVQKRFINDSVRSDFHRSFLRKYINS